eukprot:COSAG04_NODE_491_length_13463_cov_5.877432_1_plen_336_part_10
MRRAASPRNANDRFLADFENGASPATPCTCADGYEKIAPYHPAEPAEQVEAGTCWTDVGYNYNNHPHEIAEKKGKDPAACCELCSQTAGCKFFTYLNGGCYLKSSDAGRTPLHGAISGGSGAKPKLPPAAPHQPKHPPAQCDQGLRVGGGGQPCLWWSQGCSIGCAKCATDFIGPTGAAGGNPPKASKIGFRKRFCNASFNSAGAPVPMINSTLPRAARTMNVDAEEGAEDDSYRFNPWRAPVQKQNAPPAASLRHCRFAAHLLTRRVRRQGYAPVVDACGMAGGKGPKQVILPTAPGVSNEGRSSPLLALVPAVSWPWVPAWGSLEPPRRDGENA